MIKANDVDDTCRESVGAWYSEVDAYDFDAAQPFAANWSKGVGHFTQLVWRGTSGVGCGVGINDGWGEEFVPGRFMRLKCKVVVCRYQAPGNYAGNEVFRDNGE
ncbi:hypothetical protein PLESTB_000970400 [Pleodorina starrii]|uniref:SCP domain-containing protein n=1 Tax=Pleodorina starrii TaxID=330485 RepID=A0A9W6F3X7_9CHLO|nr:hypothetical protein PLESTB_000970400 [Pleodorina starrii]